MRSGGGGEAKRKGMQKIRTPLTLTNKQHINKHMLEQERGA
jgi:hypothetical protein